MSAKELSPTEKLRLSTMEPEEVMVTGLQHKVHSWEQSEPRDESAMVEDDRPCTAEKKIKIKGYDKIILLQ